ncbi:MAG: NAD-dependent epimerase/dehydratase family protein [Cytophagales bacterium]
MKIGVTGSSGLVGFNFCVEALKNNDSLNILIRKDTDYLKQIDAKVYYGDLNDIKVLDKFCEGCDVIIHSAAMISIGLDSYDEVYEVNYLGTKNLLESSKKMKVKKFIYISSINAFNKNPVTKKLDETRELVKRGNAYDMTKAMGQELVMNTDGIEKVSINPTSILGKYDFKPSRLGKVIKTLYAGKLPFLVNGGLDVIDVEDLSRAIYSSIKNGRDGETYIISGKWRSFKEINNSVQKRRDNKSFVIFFPKLFVEMNLPLLSLLPKSILRKAADFNGKYFPGLESLTKESIENIINFPKNIDNSKAKNDLGLTISSLDKTVKDSIYG